jgi:hypothetical protein
MRFFSKINLISHIAMARAGSVTIPPKHRVIEPNPAVYHNYRFLSLACNNVSCIGRKYHGHISNTISFFQKIQ